MKAWDGYSPSPFHRLSGLASRIGVADVWCKDESARFGIGSFKALGGAYAVLRTIQDELERRTGRRPDDRELADRSHPAVRELTTVTASAGNHGRSVAWGSARFGCRCVVYLPEDAAPPRAAAIESHGAEVVRYPGVYDDAVDHARVQAAANGWLVVSDTAYDGYEEIPRRVYEGYTLLADELLADLRDAGAAPLTHLFIQTGVGGLAAGVLGHLWRELGSERPRFVAVEPWRADCFGRSIRAGRAVSVEGPFATRMGGLAAGVPSPLAWTLLEGCLDAGVAIPEELTDRAAEALAAGELGASISSGPSGAAGVGALLALGSLPSGRSLLGVDAASSVGVVVTEKRF
jgi:diaminopropionate ammonia-lyase